MRRLLIEEMQNQPFLRKDEMHENMWNDLQNKTYYIKGDEWTSKLCGFFYSLHEQGYHHMLSKLANETCNYPDRSMFGEHVAYDLKQRERLKEKLNDTNEKLLDSDDDSKDLQSLRSERKRLKQEIDNWQPIESNAEMAELEKFESRIKRVKEGGYYKLMKKRNMELTDTEIYAVMKYTDDTGQLYSKLRKSHRKATKYTNSCQWKKFFYHLCCAIYKINTIFHRDNRGFKKLYVKDRPWFKDSLYRGISGIKMIGDTHPLHTISSFSGSWIVAKGFTNDNGMILSIPSAFRAIYKGQLMAADVSWISAFGEEEFLVAPISLNNIIQIKGTENNRYSHLAMDWNNINVYEIQKYESDELQSIAPDCSQRIQDPLLFFQSMLPIRNGQVSKYIAAVLAFGGMSEYYCRVCKIGPRIIEYATSLLKGYIECPSCRALYVQWPRHILDAGIDDAKSDDGPEPDPDTLECFNHKCDNGKPRIIKHTDLLKADDDEDENLGYKCRYCGMQQRQALAMRYQDNEYLDQVSEQFIKHIENATRKEDNTRKKQLDMRQGKRKQQLIEVLKYSMDIKRDNDKRTRGIVFMQKPFIIEWILESQGINKDQLIGLLPSFLKLFNLDSSIAKIIMPSLPKPSNVPMHAETDIEEIMDNDDTLDVD